MIFGQIDYRESKNHGAKNSGPTLKTPRSRNLFIKISNSYFYNIQEAFSKLTIVNHLAMFTALILFYWNYFQ